MADEPLPLERLSQAFNEKFSNEHLTQAINELMD